jgi:hypothetical protein
MKTVNEQWMEMNLFAKGSNDTLNNESTPSEMAITPYSALNSYFILIITLTRHPYFLYNHFTFFLTLQ